MPFKPLSNTRSTGHPQNPIRRRTRQALSRACTMEALECRKLLTTVGIGLDAVPSLEYVDADGQVIRVQTYGNIRAELIFLRAIEEGPNRGRLTFIDHVQPIYNQSGLANANQGADLFHIYIAQAEANSAISIARVPATGENRPMQAFTGAVPVMQVMNTDGQMVRINVPEGTGQVYIGARTGDFLDNTTDEEDLVILSRPWPEARGEFWGVRPRTARIGAGITMAPTHTLPGGQVVRNNIGRILIGGTVTGTVDLRGSIETFYAGNILTGDATGIFTSQTASIPNNFFVDGDLRNLLVTGSIGTHELADVAEPIYKTGFDLEVTGRVGQIRVLQNFLGTVGVRNRVGNVFGIDQFEVERRGPAPGSTSFFQGNADNLSFAPGAQFGGMPSLGDSPLWRNDNFQNAQYLGTFYNDELGTNAVSVRGSIAPFIQNYQDNADYYSIALMGGQTVEVQLISEFGPGGPINLGIFDPDGRLIATDYSKHGSNVGQPVRFTADRPGLYRFAVASAGDSNFNGVVDGDEQTLFAFDDYQLIVRNAGNLSLGVLAVGESMSFLDFSFNSLAQSISVDRGDVGGIVAGNIIAARSFSPGIGVLPDVGTAPFSITGGNLRAMTARQMGIQNQNNYGLGPNLRVPNGSVGLVQTTGIGGVGPMVLNISMVDFRGEFQPVNAVGGDYQIIDAIGQFIGNIITNRGIGMLRADSVGINTFAGRIAVNADNKGNDGIIDLIDIAGDFGTISAGGPGITTGPGGNVRYMRIGGTMFRDSFFGGGQPEPTLYPVGAEARLTDDSGTTFVLRPSLVGQRRQSVFNPVPQTGGQLSVLTYPIRDKGGQVVVRVDVLPGTEQVGEEIEFASNLVVEAGARGPGGGVEIAEINLLGAGSFVGFDPFTRRAELFGPEQSVILTGNSPVDVWSINSAGGISRIINGTRGEVVNVQAGSLFSIEAETIGFARQHTGAAVLGREVLVANTFPFVGQRILIDISGNIGNISSRQAVGNIRANNIASINANADNRNVRGVFEGVAGPIYTSGDMGQVNIGQGLAPSGTGEVVFGGLYANGIIDRVYGNVGADIRGNIASAGNTTIQTRQVPGRFGQTITETTPTYLIGTIELRDGSIINSKIHSGRLTDTYEFNRLHVITRREEVVFSEPTFDIERIDLRGNGGIIGTQIRGHVIGPIAIRGGFGFINSSLISIGDGTTVGINTDGYGVRDALIDGGAVLNYILASGRGQNLPVTNYSASVRQSESHAIDPFFNTTPNEFTDLHAYFLTDKDNPLRGSFTQAGSLENSVIVGSRDLGRIEVNRIVGRDPFDSFGRIPFESEAFPMRIAFGNHIGRIQVFNYMQDLSVVAGSMGNFIGGDMIHTSLSVAGRIQGVRANRLFGTTQIRASGPDGTIDSVHTRGSSYARITASVDGGNFYFGGDLGSTINIGRNLNELRVVGNVNTGANVTIANRLNRLIVGGDVQTGSRIQAASIGTQQIGGQVFGDIVIL